MDIKPLNLDEPTPELTPARIKADVAKRVEAHKRFMAELGERFQLPGGIDGTEPQAMDIKPLNPNEPTPELTPARIKADVAERVEAHKRFMAKLEKISREAARSFAERMDKLTEYLEALHRERQEIDRVFAEYERKREETRARSAAGRLGPYLSRPPASLSSSSPAPGPGGAR